MVCYWANRHLLGNTAAVTPDPADKPRFIRWLFVDRWDAGAAAFIE
jgi:hypothetical protein